MLYLFALNIHKCGLGSNRKRLELPFVATANMYFYRFMTQTLGFTQSDMHVIED